MEVMRFERVLQRILKQVITVDPRIRPVCLSKVDLAEAYMMLWASMEDIPSVAFIIPKKNPSYTHMGGFHLSLPMSYVDSAPYFCMEM